MKKSIMKKSQTEMTASKTNKKAETDRIDMYNNQIEEGQKKHQITFRDKVQSKPIQDVYHVESYKQYNREEEDQQPAQEKVVDTELAQSQKKTQVCNCSIF